MTLQEYLTQKDPQRQSIGNVILTAADIKEVLSAKQDEKEIKAVRIKDPYLNKFLYGINENTNTLYVFTEDYYFKAWSCFSITKEELNKVL